MSKKKFSLLAVVRIRGRVDQSKDTKHALKLLNLTRSNHAVLVPNDKTHQGMLQTAKDAITWGEVSKETVKALIEKRGRIVGNKPIDTKFLKQHKFASKSAFVTAIVTGKADMRRIEGLKPLFRLHPPRKGFKAVKDPVNRGGDLGYRGEAINELLQRML